MTSNQPTVPGLNPNRHYMTLLGGKDDQIRIRFGCGSGADVSLSEVRAGLIMELEDDIINFSKTGPLFVDCARHGQYLAFWQLLRKAAKTADSYPVSMPLLLIPLRDVEHVISEGMK